MQEDYVEKEFDGNSIWHENVIDGLHKTDLGYLATAKGLYKLLKKYYKKKGYEINVRKKY